MSRQLPVRIAPLSPPYDDEVDAMLKKWMPPGADAPPLALFRTLAKHRALSDGMRKLGATFLSRGALDLRARELVILRACAACGAEYEWGVHVTAFASAAGLDEATVRATRTGEVDGLQGRDRVLMTMVDALHREGTLDAAVFDALAAHFDEAQILELLALTGFYHLISFVVNGCGTSLEPWATRFPSGANS